MQESLVLPQGSQGLPVRKRLCIPYIPNYETSNQGSYTQRQVNECKVLQEKSLKKGCQILPKNADRRRVSVVFICHKTTPQVTRPEV